MEIRIQDLKMYYITESELGLSLQNVSTSKLNYLSDGKRNI